MPSFDDLSHRLLKRLATPNMIRPQGDDLFFYLVFPPEQMLAAKRFTPTLRARLQNAGYDVVDLSMTDVVGAALTEHPMWDVFLEGERMDPGDLEGHAGTVREVLEGDHALLNAFRARLAEARARSNGLVLVTDVEALHPYARMQPVEARLVNEVDVPVVVLYPGLRTGRYSLRFLGFYDDDSGYRSQFIDLNE